ncbi:MAG: DUF4040 domain-containing protein [Rickettsia sp.]|nr:DUF4040 domain-containing protein [Rickettsia sp.]
MKNNFFLIPLQMQDILIFILLFISLSMLVFVAWRIKLASSFFEEIVVISSIFSINISVSYLLLDAPDVAMTETAVMSCISTIFLLHLIKIIGARVSHKGLLIRKKISFFACGILVASLIWVGLEISSFGELNPINNELTMKYYHSNREYIAVPSLVASILASFRGFDTLGETLVILIAGLSVVLLFSVYKYENHLKNK